MLIKMSEFDKKLEKAEKLFNEMIDYIAAKVNKRIMEFGETAEEALHKVMEED